MSTLYLLNSPVLPGFGRYEFEGPVLPQEARRLAAGGYVSAIGHEATARLLSHILGELLSNLVYGLRRRSCLTDPVLVPHP